MTEKRHALDCGLLSILNADHQQDPESHLFDIGPAGKLRVNPRWRQSLDTFCQCMKDATGEQVKVQFWPYRIGNVTWVAFDAAGTYGEVTLTITEANHIEIPLQDISAGNNDPVCLVIDAVDAFYLAFMLLDTLGLKSASEGSYFFGTRTIAK